MSSRRAFMGPIYIVFEEGVAARVDPYTNNAMELIQRMSDRLHPDNV